MKIWFPFLCISSAARTDAVFLPCLLLSRYQWLSYREQKDAEMFKILISL